MESNRECRYCWSLSQLEKPRVDPLKGGSQVERTAPFPYSRGQASGPGVNCRWLRTICRGSFLEVRSQESQGLVLRDSTSLTGFELCASGWY